MRVLLHTCCGNCAIIPVKRLREQHHDVTAFFFNPNIHPYREFQRRLTARKAAEEGYDAFSTSLLYSRYQQHDKLREYGELLAEEYGVLFHYEDYRTGWKEGIDASRGMQLYRQQYCGCIYSEMDRYAPQRRN